MRRAVGWAFITLPLIVVVISVAVPMPLRLSMGGIIFGLLFFQLALVGSFNHFLPNTRRYIALRAEVDHLLQLVRELNAAAVEARRAGEEREEIIQTLVQELHQSVDRLPRLAGQDETEAKGAAIH